MFSRKQTSGFTESCSDRIKKLKEEMETADAIVIGAGSGLSAAAGLTYSGERFRKYFSDFAAKYPIRDIYSGGFYPFPDITEYWAWWSRHIYYNRYVDAPKLVYRDLLELVRDKDYFVLTTNVDHQFQRAGFDKKRLFYTQGDYGLFQCSKPCCQETLDNGQIIEEMIRRQSDMRIPTDLIPHCPHCGEPLTVNLRCDDTFVQDPGWYQAQSRYQDFLRRHEGLHVLFLELGVGGNTPVIIKYPFWQMTKQNPKAVYACINYGEAICPNEIKRQSICIDRDIAEVIGICLNACTEGNG